MHFDGHWLTGQKVTVVHCYHVPIHRLKRTDKVTVTFQAHRLQSIPLRPCLHQSCCNYKSTDNSQSYHKFSKFSHYLILDFIFYIDSIHTTLKSFLISAKSRFCNQLAEIVMLFRHIFVFLIIFTSKNLTLIS